MKKVGKSFVPSFPPGAFIYLFNYTFKQMLNFVPQSESPFIFIEIVYLFSIQLPLYLFILTLFFWAAGRGEKEEKVF